MSDDPTSALEQPLDRALDDGWLSLAHQMRVALVGIEHSPAATDLSEAGGVGEESGSAIADADLS